MTRGKTATFIRCKIRNAGRSHFQIAPQVELELLFNKTARARYST